jgi:5-methylcytosine-specific restriction endonuclease McrA
MGMKRKPGRWALQTSEWQKVRRKALRRDGWRCKHCGRVTTLEVHHVVPVREAPDRAFDLNNLLTLCRRCHAHETAAELGHKPDPERRAWRDSVADLATSNRATGVNHA